MALDAALLALMIQTVGLAAQSGTTGAGYAVPTYGSVTTYAARLEFKDEWVRAHDGREIAARGRAYVNIGSIGAIPDVTAQVTLPAGYTPAHPPILDVQPIFDEQGLNHVVLVLG